MPSEPLVPLGEGSLFGTRRGYKSESSLGDGADLFGPMQRISQSQLFYWEGLVRIHIMTCRHTPLRDTKRRGTSHKLLFSKDLFRYTPSLADWAKVVRGKRLDGSGREYHNS